MDRVLSRTAEYALRAMIFLNRHADEWPISGPRIAASAGIPRSYLSTILGNLVRARLLVGLRGKLGGFRLSQSPKQIRLTQVVAPFEPANLKKICPFGNAVCSDRNSCVAHARWSKVNATLSRFIEEMTLERVPRVPSASEKGGRER